MAGDRVRRKGQWSGAGVIKAVRTEFGWDYVTVHWDGEDYMPTFWRSVDHLEKV